jgi:hypothetical protein
MFQILRTLAAGPGPHAALRELRGRLGVATTVQTTAGDPYDSTRTGRRWKWIRLNYPAKTLAILDMTIQTPLCHVMYMRGPDPRVDSATARTIDWWGRWVNKNGLPESDDVTAFLAMRKGPDLNTLLSGVDPGLMRPGELDAAVKAAIAAIFESTESSWCYHDYARQYWEEWFSSYADDTYIDPQDDDHAVVDTYNENINVIRQELDGDFDADFWCHAAPEDYDPQLGLVYRRPLEVGLSENEIPREDLDRARQIVVLGWLNHADGTLRLGIKDPTRLLAGSELMNRGFWSRMREDGDLYKRDPAEKVLLEISKIVPTFEGIWKIDEATVKVDPRLIPVAKAIREAIGSIMRRAWLVDYPLISDAIPTVLVIIRDWLVARPDEVLGDDSGAFIRLSWEATSEHFRAIISSIAVTREDADPGTFPVATFQDGAMIVRLTTSEALIWEGRAMSHCVGGSDYLEQLEEHRIMVFSYRDKNDVPRITWACQPESYRTVDLQGPHNGPIRDEAAKRRLAWFIDALVIADLRVRALIKHLNIEPGVRQKLGLHLIQASGQTDPDLDSIRRIHDEVIERSWSVVGVEQRENDWDDQNDEE